jgi:hypothetical protein
VLPPVPVLTLTAVAPVTLPIVMILATASVPKLIAPPLVTPNGPAAVIEVPSSFL